jgi:hypothetical protein
VRTIDEATTEGDINEMVFNMTAAVLKDYCETRVGAGVSNAQLNEELKLLVPHINVWSRRQRTLLRLMLNDPPSRELQ